MVCSILSIGIRRSICLSTNDAYRALEELNYQNLICLDSMRRECVLAHRIVRLRDNIPFGLVPLIARFLKQRRASRLSATISSPVTMEEFTYVSPAPVHDRRGVVFTCITHGYDLPKEPILTANELSYMLYTDSVDEGYRGVWNQIKIDSAGVNLANSYLNRWYKFHPFELFPDKEYAIYVDGNVQIVSDLTGLYRVARESPVGIAMHRHANRSCLYKDARWCEYNDRGNVPAICMQVERYRKEGFPEDFGLCEATIIVFDLKSEMARTVVRHWWDEFCRAGGMRDQIVFPYVIWRLGLQISDVGYLGNDEYHNPKFIIGPHAAHTLV